MSTYISIMVLGAALLIGIRYPGILIAGTFFTYQAEVLMADERVVPAYLGAALAIQIGRWMIRAIKPRLTGLDLSLFAVLAILFLSSFWSADQEATAASAGQLVATVLVTYATCRLSAVDVQKIIGQLCIGLVTFGPIMALAMYQARATDTYTAATRLIVEGGSAVGLAQPLPFVLVAAVALLVFNRGKLLRMLALNALAVTAYVTIVSSTRSVLLSAAIGAAIILFVAARKRRMATIFVTGTGVVLAGWLALSIVDPQTSESFLERVSLDGGVRDTSTLERIELQKDALTVFADAPLLGQGYDSFRLFAYYAYPHNSVLEFMVSTGVIGTTIYLVYIFFLLRAVRDYRKELPGTGTVLLALLAVVLAQSMVSFSFVMLKPLFIFTGLAAAGLRTVELVRRTQISHHVAPHVNTSSYSKIR